MARLTDDEIERLKKEISIERLVSSSGVKLTKAGANVVGRCPFHDDKTPSLVVTPKKNLWHCMGACQMGGSVIDWVMKLEGLSFRHAVDRLRKGVDMSAPVQGAPPVPKKRGTVRKLELALSAESTDAEVLEQVAAFYHSTLKTTEEPRAYLKARGLDHPEIVERFRLGYSNRTLGYHVPLGNRKVGAEIRGHFERLGVLRQSGHEHLSGSLVVPLFDAYGRMVQLYGRKTREDLRAGTPKHLYLPGPHRGVFNRDGIATSDEVILCEAVIDALTFWAAGYRNVTTAYGVEGLTDEIVDALVAAKVRVVKIAFDRDEAGDRAAQRVSARLLELGIATYRVVFPNGMDANEYALKLGPATKSLGLVLRQAQWMAGAERRVEPGVKREEALRELAAEPKPLPAGDDVVAQAEVATTRHESPAPIPSLVASPNAAEAPTAKPHADGEDLFFVFADRKWRIRPMPKSGSGSELKVHVILSRENDPGAFFVDTVDLYSARHRTSFAKQAAEELGLDEGLVRRELGQIVLELEKAREVKAREDTRKASASSSPAMTEEERAEALAYLRSPKLLDRMLRDFERAGIVGEETNKLVSYIAASSRKLEEPLAVVIQSSSAAGKSSLMDAVLALMPDEERVQYSAMTGQSLFYMSGQSLKHKILAIVEEEGAERASYALKLLQSEGELTIASTGKDPATGRLVTQTYRVEGPVMIFLTTTAIEVDEELMNRCVVLTVDEGREQTRAIHERQRRAQTLEGLLERSDRDQMRRVHKNAQRLLRPLFVVNPFALELGFADHATRTRRDHMKYLTLIRSITLLHQYQRPVKRTEVRGQVIEYVESTREDVALATRLAHGVLGRSLDELPPQTRRLLGLVHEMVKARMAKDSIAQRDVRFTRRDVREATGWGNTQLKIHLRRLEELEYLLVHRFGRGPLMNHYELAYGGEGQDGGRFVLGLKYDQERSGSEGDRSGSGRASVGPRSGLGRDDVMGVDRSKTALNGAAHPNAAKSTVREAPAPTAS